MENLIKLVCPFCNKSFTTKNRQQKYCTKKCQMSNGWEEHKKRAVKEKQKSDQFFRWEDFNNDVIF